MAFDPTSAAVSVRAVDGRTSGAQVLDWFTGPISMARTDGGTLAGGAATNAVAGVASFPSLQIASAGFFRLRPATTAAGFATAEASAQFPITDQKADCKPNQCTDTIGNTTLTGTTTQEGFVLLSDNVAPEPTCSGYKPPSATWYDFLVTVPATKIIRTEYTKDEMKSFKGGSSALQVCFAVPVGGLFASPFDYDNDGMNEGSVGLLPDCPLEPTSPCVTNRGNVPAAAPSSSSSPRPRSATRGTTRPTGRTRTRMAISTEELRAVALSRERRRRRAAQAGRAAQGRSYPAGQAIVSRARAGSGSS